VGWDRALLRRLVLYEHGQLLGTGMAGGLICAALAVAPAILAAGKGVPYLSLILTIAVIGAGGILWTVLATALALRGELQMALRNE
jgi:hypothetical protein